MIAVRDLEVRRDGRTICRVGALDVPRGARLLVRGRNGAGKTTLLRVLAGLEAHFGGTVDGLPPPERRVLVHQDPFVFRGSVRHNVGLGLSGRGLGREERAARVVAILGRFGLDAVAGRDARRLSGGERRRVALARALVLEPDLVLLDEPLSDLDASGRDVLLRALAERPDMSVVVASPTDVPDDLARTVVELSA